jgi:hypothetical protein
MGKYTDALAEFRAELRLEPDERETREAAQECERFAQLDVRFPALLKGSDRPANAAERMDLAQMCYDRRLFRASARFSREAFAEKPALAEDRKRAARYDAACAAALAGCGRGEDDPPPDEAARAALRRQALAWLKNDLADWVKTQKDAPRNQREKALATLRHWKQDSDLAGLRDLAELAKLPSAERDACCELWAQVDEQLKEDAE